MERNSLRKKLNSARENLSTNPLPLCCTPVIVVMYVVVVVRTYTLDVWHQNVKVRPESQWGLSFWPCCCWSQSWTAPKCRDASKNCKWGKQVVAFQICQFSSHICECQRVVLLFRLLRKCCHCESDVVGDGMAEVASTQDGWWRPLHPSIQAQWPANQPTSAS